VRCEACEPAELRVEGGRFGGNGLSPARVGEIFLARPAPDIFESVSDSTSKFPIYLARGMSQTDNALNVHGGIEKFVSATVGVGRGLPVYMLQSEATIVVDVSLTN